MAAHSNNFIRLRLYFDYPPPAAAGCRMCWLLVDLNTCRVVADLESTIREKFEFGRRSILNLFIQDCYLPHTESIYVVRDNDSVRVKVDCLAQVNGHITSPETASGNSRKRQRANVEDVSGENGTSVEWKKKKRKKNNTEEGTKQASGDKKDKKSPEKHREKKKKKKVEKNGVTATTKPTASPKITPAHVNQPSTGTKKPPAKPQPASSSDSSSSSSEEDDAPKKPATKTLTSTSAASKTQQNTKPTQKKPPPSSSSSSETDSSSDEAKRVKIPPKNKPTAAKSKPHPATATPLSTNCAQKPAAGVVKTPLEKAVQAQNAQDSEEEIQLVIRKPLKPPLRGVGGQSPFWQGRGRGQPWRGGGGGGQRGRSGGRGDFTGHSGSFESSCDGVKEPSCQTDTLTNMSVVLQNGAEGAPKQDYSSMPLLAAPPQVGQRIAFKLLELTENYTPEVSEYKEAKIVNFDPSTKQIELELLHASHAPVEPGKFDLVYQNPDGSERVEYAVSRGSWVTERWDSLLEPRLII